MKKLLLLLFGLTSALDFHAQSLIINLTNSTSETFTISGIQSIKFGTETMMLTEFNGTVNTWNIEDIDNYAFDGVANIDETTTITTDELNIFPNPTTDKVTINYTSNHSGNIDIAVYDINGRLIDVAFSGKHNKETKVYWDAKQNQTVQAGKYFITITTETKVITKPVIVQ